MRTGPDQIALPRIDEVPSSVAFTAVARQLEATYSNVVAEGLPEPLAGLAERLSQDDPPDAAGGEGSSQAEARPRSRVGGRARWAGASEGRLRERTAPSRSCCSRAWVRARLD